MKAADVNAAFAQAVALHQRGRLAEAQAIYRDILRAVPDHFDAVYLFGVTQAQSGKLAEAEVLIRRALKINPRAPAAHSDLGNVLSGLGRHKDAIASFDQAVALKSDYAEAHLNRGNALMKLARHAEAVASYDRAIAIKPGLADAFANRGMALTSLGQLDAALASIDRALALMPGNVNALAQRAEALRVLRRHDEAVVACDRALALNANLVGVWLTRGKSLLALKRAEETVAAFRKAAELQPDLADAWYGLGIGSFELKRHADAVTAYDRALAIGEPDYARGFRLHAKMHACDWSGFDADCAQLLSAVRAGKRAAAPLAILPIASTAEDQLKCAELFIAQVAPAAGQPLWRGETYTHDRLRIAYLSTDLVDHPVAYLIAGLFEHHDRSRFQTTAISIGPDRDVGIRRRIQKSFDQFVDARLWPDRRIAEQLRAMETDILIDLNGITGDARSGVLARRAAPIQVNYLGWPATMGASYIDYIIADRTLIPEDQQRCYAEKVVYLPDSYQPNDSQRQIAERVPTRAEAGLPPQGFVFCSFNNSFKITPDVFDIWMRLLQQVEGSVLWLYEGSSLVPVNLRREAQARGVAPERLVFASRVPMEDHLARHRLADLCLDTLYYNGHTTASDSLWAGVPYLTRAGATFASRVGASLLNAVGLPELVASSLEDYEALALKLARDPAALGSIKDKLARHRASQPLFDTARTTRHFEAALTQMWERHRRGEPPASFAVP